MTLRWGDRVLETATTTGTGAFTLAGAVTGYQRFSAIPNIATNDTVYYSIYAVDANGTPTGDWESGLGTYSAANTLTRTTVLESSNANAAVSFAAGTKYVAVSPVASFVGALGRVLLEQHTASSSATLDFTTAISATYDEYEIEFVNVIPATNAVNLLIRMSTDGGSTYDSGANYAWAVLNLNRFGSASSGADSGATGIQSNYNGVDNTATKGISGSVKLFSPASTAVHKQVVGTLTNTSSGSIEATCVTGSYLSATAVNAFRFLFSSGNIASGIIRVYGLAK